MCSRVLRLLLPRVTGSRRKPILSTLSISPRSIGLPMMKGPESCCAPSFARLAADDVLPLPLPLCRGVSSIWGMEERSGGVNGRNGPGLGTRGFLLVGCIDFAGACNKIDDPINLLVTLRSHDATGKMMRDQRSMRRIDSCRFR